MKNNEKISHPDNSAPACAPGRIDAAAKGLVYISETDADIIPFAGEKCDRVTAQAVLRVSKRAADEPVEELVPAEFFAQLTQTKDWFGEREKDRATRFAGLYTALTEELRELHAFRIGQIQIDIFVVGIDSAGRLAGIRTKAVET